MKKTIILLSFIMQALWTKAQFGYGAQFGYTRNHLITDISNRSFTKNDDLSGYSFGIPLEFQLGKLFSLASSPEFIQKNYSFKRTEAFDGVHQSFINSYIQLPIMIQLNYDPGKIRLYLKGGIYGAYWMYGKVKGVIPNILNSTESLNTDGSFSNYASLSSYNERYDFNNKKDNRIEFGWLGGGGISYPLNRKYRLFIEGRFYQSLTDQQKQDMTQQIQRNNATLSISTGCMFYIF